MVNFPCKMKNANHAMKSFLHWLSTRRIRDMKFLTIRYENRNHFHWIKACFARFLKLFVVLKAVKRKQNVNFACFLVQENLVFVITERMLPFVENSCSKNKESCYIFVRKFLVSTFFSGIRKNIVTEMQLFARTSL